MTSHDSDEAAPALLAGKHQGRIYHGPIDLRLDDSNIQLVTLTGPGEADLLRAAASWLADRPTAILISINWYDALLGPRTNLAVLPPLHRLDLTVRLRH